MNTSTMTNVTKNDMHEHWISGKCRNVTPNKTENQRQKKPSKDNKNASQQQKTISK